MAFLKRQVKALGFETFELASLNSPRRAKDWTRPACVRTGRIAMRRLDRMSVEANRTIELWSGDLTDPQAPGADLLVVSAFPNDYLPVPGTVIGALEDSGLSLASLAADKEEDLRENFSCWLSRPLDVSLPYKRILCFEPRVRGRPADLVGDIFRSIAPFAHAFPLASVAMPLVAAGDQMEPPEEASRHFSMRPCSGCGPAFRSRN